MPYEVGLDAVEELKKLVPAGATMAQFALRWILMDDAVTVVIPGAKNKAQAEANSAAARLPALSADVMAAAKTGLRRRASPSMCISCGERRWFCLRRLRRSPLSPCGRGFSALASQAA